jgi:hypothetical protein
MIKCEKCGQSFEKNCFLIRHQNKKFPCDSIKNINRKFDLKINKIEEQILILETNSKLIKPNKKIRCLFCKTIFTMKCNLIKHMKDSCKIKKTMENEKTNLIKEKDDFINNKNKIEIEIETEILKNKINNLELENLELKKLELENLELKKIIPKIIPNITPNIIPNILPNITQSNIPNVIINQTVNQTINNTQNNTQNNTSNTQNNTITMNPFGKEDLSHIKIEDYLKFLNTFFPGFVGYVNKVHFDENMPQNHNILISNLRSKYISIYDGEKWITKDKNDIIDNLILKKHNQLSSICEQLENENKLDKNIIENFEEFCESFKNKEAQKTIKNNIVSMLYDNRNKIKSNNKKIENKNFKI